MARSNIHTWLPIDEFAQTLGLDPLGFNQLASNTLRRNITCGEIFFQSSWQHSDRVGRDDIAMALQAAEQEIAREAGFNLLPDWTVAERLPYPRPMLPEAYGAGINVRWMAKSVEALRGHVISGGMKAKSLIQAGAVVVRTDSDGDGYAETCTIIVPVTTTDLNEFHVYYSTKAGDDGWEIRPITVAVSGGFATIQFKSWQIVVSTVMDQLDAQPVDADDPASYETTVDVYRVYNDPSTQVQFLWENTPDCISCCGSCAACQLGSQMGCFHLRDARMGFVVPAPATWDARTEEFTAADYSVCREPDQVQLWYRSGWRDMSLARPYVELASIWKYAISYFAASKFDRPVCGCSNVHVFIDKWRRDAAFTSMTEGGITMTAEQASNRLGTSMGALYAWRTIQQLGVRVNK